MVAKLTNVKAVKAHILNGQIVLDEPVELPEGTAVEVLVPDDDALTPEELTELEAALDESEAQFARGEAVDGISFARKLASRS